MRILLARTDHIGDLIVSLPVQKCILDHDPTAEIFWFVRPEIAPILEHLPSASGVFVCHPDHTRHPYEKIFKYIKPDILLNLSHLDPMVIPAGKKAGIPIRVASPIGRLFSQKTLTTGYKDYLATTHFLWNRRNDAGKHESQLALNFLRPLNIPVPDSIPEVVPLVLTTEELEQGELQLKKIPHPRLGLIPRGATGACPSLPWWRKMLEALKTTRWNTVILSPPEESRLPQTSIRGLMARLSACDAVIGVSAGPTHLAAALNVPTLCLMPNGNRQTHERWMPLGNSVVALQYPGEPDDFGSGMDRFSTDTVLEQLEKLQACKGRWVCNG
jgi:ADP-heptose:LPS heptosyltransferase